ncbi:hypothetical protein RD110_17930 [Rhodoferax koreense]|uniref:DUF3775 domain-containing protein n=1 Tax=Rhodoferax koreensis TaxID=1842727 RepID=A0A1P8JYN2_9BURK|nr:hypothetical protein [Rhodoferax koreense]APW38855.1 hypothetical protein RD110_17930 [Rhodoferax koreense]
MDAQSTLAVIEYLVSQSAARVGKVDGERSGVAEEYVAIFDELDSLTADEFSEVLAMYLVGSSRVKDFEQAREVAVAAKFSPLEAMAHDINLHVVLARGLEAYRDHVHKG